MTDGPGLDRAWLDGDGRAAGLLGPPPELTTLLDRASGLEVARPEVVAALARAHADDPTDVERDAALRKLADGAVVVTTGQQPGLLGGALLVGFKIATAIALARRLEREGRPAVAVFWNASEDHDFDEANRLELRTPDRLDSRLHHLPLGGRGRSFDRVIVDDESVREYERLIAESGEGGVVAEDGPRAGEDLGRWMRREQLRRFAGSGLIVLEPRDVQPESAEIRRAIWREEDTLRAAWLERREELRIAGWTPQLDEPDEDRSLLLWSDDEGRRRLEGRGATARLPDGRPLTGLGDDAIELSLSPSALLRPLVQRALLPVAAQICGPAEIRYLAEVAPLFTALGLRAPLVWPRASGALLEAEEWSTVRELGLEDARLLQDPETWPDANAADVDGETSARLREILDRGLEEARRATVDDPRWREGMDALTRAVERGLRDAEDRWRKQVARAAKDERRRRRRLATALFPRGGAQQRRRSLGCYDHGRGADLGRWLVDAIDPLAFEDHILRLPERNSP
ncbi:MAG: bacillithiol biosynthesis BshC [Planctomycetota bacterium]